MRRALADVHFLHFAGNSGELDLAGEPEAPAPARASTAGRRERVRAPVAMAIFRRPDTTAQVLAEVRRARPRELLVFADGPRSGAADDERLCAEARAVITEGVDWDCRLRTSFSDVNLGVKGGMERGLDWVFAEVEEAIVLEDDCIPDPSFFAYCDELLERYRDDERVFAVSGNDFRFREVPARDDYTFSRYPLIWGWATWRRAWRHYDGSLAAWPELRRGGWLEELLGDPYAAKYWAHQFDRVDEGFATWDYPWVLACWVHGGLTAVPTTNLVSNVGFRPDATHTRATAEGRHPFAAMATAPIPFPLAHPPAVARDEETDAFLEDIVFSGNLRRTFEQLRAGREARLAPAEAGR